jgi:integrase/recombinase XerD
MTLLAPHITAFLQQRLPNERRASPNTCDSYAYAFRLLFEYASVRIKHPPSQLQLEELDAPLIVDFLNHLETTRGNGAGSRNIRLAAIKSFMRYMEYRAIGATADPTHSGHTCEEGRYPTSQASHSHGNAIDIGCS